ncbi:MAG: oxidoreductase [Actinomycetota bacterium]
MISRAVLITGCSTGIGRATAERFARAGFPVYATARNLDSVGDIQGVERLRLDVTEEGSMRAAVQHIEARHGAVGALVNNAGFGLEGPVEETSMDDIRKQFETNVFGVVRLTQLVLPKMREQRFGRIVNVGSMGGRMVFPGGTFYHATKYALEAFSDGLRYEVRPFGIDVSLIEPGVIKTQFGATAMKKIPQVSDGPYASFNKGLFDRFYGTYEGKSSRWAASPDAVARAIFKAVHSKHPLTRYRVTVSGRALLMIRKVVPDRTWDLLMRTNFPPPRP